MALEHLIQFVTILFLLSVICERMANFIKLYIDNENTWLKRVIRKTLFIEGSTAKRLQEQSLESARTYNIMKLNLICGMITAVFMDADLIQIIANIDNSSKVIGWPMGSRLSWDYVLQAKFLLKPVGWLLTACFISLGSKFWHDLLDIIFEIKRAKNISNEKEKANTTNSWETLPEATQYEIADRAILDHFELWKKIYPGLNGVSVDKPNPSGSVVLTFQASGVRNLSLPQSIFYAGYHLPIRIEDVTEAHSNAGHPGCSVAHVLGTGVSRSNAGSTGSIGAIVRLDEEGEDKEERYILSCFHVLFPHELKHKEEGIVLHVNNKHQQLLNQKVLSPGYACASQANVGYVYEGMFGNYMDAGIARVNGYAFSNQLLDTTAKIQGEFVPSKADCRHLDLQVCGCISGIKSAKLHSISTAQSIRFGQKRFTLYGMYAISGFIARDGDSGGAVLDSRNRIIGIVSASDSGYTYVIPFSTIKNNLNIELA